MNIAMAQMSRRLANRVLGLWKRGMHFDPNVINLALYVTGDLETLA